jgi:hypothetical protein
MVLDTSDFPRGCRGFAASEDPLGVKVPSARWRLVLRKFRHTKHCRRWEGKLAEQRPPPIRTRDPGEGQSRPSSQFMKALQDPFAHQSKPHMRRNPIGLVQKAGQAGRLTIGTWLVFPAGTRGAPAKIVPVVSRQGSHAPRTLASPEDASMASNFCRDGPPIRVDGPTSHLSGKATINDAWGRTHRNGRITNLLRAAGFPLMT